MKKLYWTDEARQSALVEINKQIDTLMTLPCSVLGGYGEATKICRNLSDLKDVIVAEADDASQLDLFARNLAATRIGKVLAARKAAANA